MGLWKMSLVSKGAIFHFHYCWKKRNDDYNFTMVVNCGRISFETWKSEVANFSIFAAEFKGPSLC